MRAEALTRLGKWNEAIAALEPLRNDPKARRARLLLGQLYIMTGRRPDAEDPLMSIISDYNQNNITSTTPRGSRWWVAPRTSCAARTTPTTLMGRPRRPVSRQSRRLLYRAELFLEKYDPGHAEEVVKEALKIAPHNAAAHVTMARVKLDQAFDFDAAEHQIKEAWLVDPKNQGAFFVAAGLALRNMDLAQADALLDQGLGYNPDDLELLSMKAAVRFLADDRAGSRSKSRQCSRRTPSTRAFIRSSASSPSGSIATTRSSR